MTRFVNCGRWDIGPNALTFAASSHEAYLYNMIDMCGGGMLLSPISTTDAATQTSVHALQDQEIGFALNST